MLNTLNLSTEQACAAQHFGLWLIEPLWFNGAVAAIKAGTFQPKAARAMPSAGEDGGRPLVDSTGIAHIQIAGQMVKGGSSFSGTSTIDTRRNIRTAVASKKVKGILMHIDSPGGTVAGTAALADDVQAANQVKPVYTHFEDLGASAAYWVGAQARQVSAERTSLIGSIGTLAYIVDTSGEFEQMGWTAHVISTGKFKGVFSDGTEITKDQLAYAQQLVDASNDHFLHAVSEGRRMPMADVQKLADGRLHDADKAKALGLIDVVQSVDDTVVQLRELIKSTDSRHAEANFAEAKPIQRRIEAKQ